ncbi:MAG: hypothetical protein OER12_03800, partial [Acidimicrobiia bacterium]|nr:hypothetical protein [Acidimicrobiia bacterium]
RTEGDSPETARETLRTYTQATGSVDQFAVTGGWESGSIGISVGGSNAAAYWGAEGTTGFSFYDESGGFVGFAGDPYGPDVFCGDGTLYDVTTGDLVGSACFEFAELSDDGRLAYYERDFDGAQTRYLLVVVDLDSGEELFRQDLERPDQGWAPTALDLRGDQILVNRTESGEWGAPYIDALLIDITTGSVTEIGIDGQARFLVGPMGIS